MSIIIFVLCVLYIEFSNVNNLRSSNLGGCKVVRCLHDVVVDANGKANQNPDINGVCHGDDLELHCPLSEGGKLPSLQLTNQDGLPVLWVAVYFSCNPSSSGSIFDIALPSSIFGDKFQAQQYDFDFENCNFVLAPDLFTNTVTAGDHVWLKYDLGQSKYQTRYNCVNEPFFLTIVNYNNANTICSLSDSLTGSAMVTFTSFTKCSIIPSETFTNMPQLTSIYINNGQGTLLVQSRAFWRLPDNIDIAFAKSLVTLETKAISQIAIIDSVTFYTASYHLSILKSIETGAFDSITTISNMVLNVLHDAFQGPIFSDVSQVGHLELYIYPSHPNCTLSSVQCMVNIDFGATNVDRLDIIMLGTTFLLPSNDLLGRPSTLGITLQLCIASDSEQYYYWGDPWAEASHIHDVIQGVKTAEFNLGCIDDNGDDDSFPGPCASRQPFFLPINLTSTGLESVQLTTVLIDHPICDSSWLTAPKSLKSIQLRYPDDRTDGSNPYPLIIRSPHISHLTTVSIPSGSTGYAVHCACSMSWLKQVMDCPTGVKLSSQWLGNSCSFLGGKLSVEQFLNSTSCCASIEPPTKNNEPNMPLGCNEFLPIPPELLYFKHTDLPQCRESGDWEWDPCDVISFYNNRSTSTTKTTNPTTATTTKPTTITSTSTVTTTRFASTTKSTIPTTAPTTKPTTVTSTSTIATTTHVPGTTTYSPDDTTVVATTPRVPFSTITPTGGTNWSDTIQSLIVGFVIGFVFGVVFAFIVAIFCYKFSPRMRRPFHHLIAMVTNIDILPGERMLYIAAMTENLEPLDKVLNWQEMVERGRKTIIPDSPTGDLTIFTLEDYDDLKNLRTATARINFLDKLRTKPRLVLKWFLIQLIKDGHHDVVELIRKGVDARRVIRDQNTTDQVESVAL